MKQKENSLDFVAKHYKEGFLNSRKAWGKFKENNLGQVVPLRRSWLKVASAAAILIAVAGIGIVYATREVTISTIAGESMELYLPDHSLVKLQEKSQLSYNRWDYNSKNRQVQMSGKIFFQIKRNEHKPFIVSTSNSQVKVLGTSFTIQSSTQRTSVDVHSGKVEFRSLSSKEKSILTQHMTADYNANTNEMTVISPQSGFIIYPKKRSLQFDHTPVEEAVRQLNIYYGTSIVYNEQGNDSLFLTATFNNTSIENIIDVINETLGIKLKMKIEN